MNKTLSENPFEEKPIKWTADPISPRLDKWLIKMFKKREKWVKEKDKHTKKYNGGL